MTTIIGIKTNSGEEGIVLAADLRFNWYDDSGEEIIRKEIASKLHRGRNYVMGFSGLDDNHLTCFFNYLAGEREFSDFVKFISGDQILQTSEPSKVDPISTAIQSKYLEALNLLNRYHAKRHNGSIEDCIELVLVVNKPNLQLYFVDAFGNISLSTRPGGLGYVCCGSGSKEVKDYFDDQECLNDDRSKDLNLSIDAVTIPMAIRLALGAMGKVARDPEMGDLTDIVVVKENQIESHEGGALKSVRAFYEQLIKQYEK